MYVSSAHEQCNAHILMAFEKRLNVATLRNQCSLLCAYANCNLRKNHNANAQRTNTFLETHVHNKNVHKIKSIIFCFFSASLSVFRIEWDKMQNDPHSIFDKGNGLFKSIGTHLICTGSSTHQDSSKCAPKIRAI